MFAVAILTSPLGQTIPSGRQRRVDTGVLMTLDAGLIRNRSKSAGVALATICPEVLVRGRERTGLPRIEKNSTRRSCLHQWEDQEHNEDEDTDDPREWPGIQKPLTNAQSRLLCQSRHRRAGTLDLFDLEGDVFSVGCRDDAKFVRADSHHIAGFETATGDDAPVDDEVVRVRGVYPDLTADERQTRMVERYRKARKVHTTPGVPAQREHISLVELFSPGLAPGGDGFCEDQTNTHGVSSSRRPRKHE